jgi:hypothetical protein
MLYKKNEDWEFVVIQICSNYGTLLRNSIEESLKPFEKEGFKIDIIEFDKINNEHSNLYDYIVKFAYVK